MMAQTSKSYRRANRGAGRPAVRAAHPVPRNCEPVCRMPQAADMTPEPTPIWLAALIATRCQATGNGDHAVLWNHVSGRALYTKAGSDTETIERLGVSLQHGHTVAVFWVPGETAYTVEVYRQYDLCA